MTTVNIKEGTAAPPFDDISLAATETDLRNKLPADFLKFLRASNGGIPVDQFFPLRGNLLVVERFLSIANNDQRDTPSWKFDIQVVTGDLCDALDDTLFPFAVLFGGDFLCFQYNSMEQSRIVILDHEESFDNIPHVAPVCDTFDELLGLLTSRRLDLE